MDVREKLAEIVKSAAYCCLPINTQDRHINMFVTDLLAHGVTVQEWFSVSDSPKERGCYLVTVRRWLDGKPVVREAYWNSADWLSCYRRGVEITPSVTHWMPLPEPPKEGED